MEGLGDISGVDGDTANRAFWAMLGGLVLGVPPIFAMAAANGIVGEELTRQDTAAKATKKEAGDLYKTMKTKLTPAASQQVTGLIKEGNYAAATEILTNQDSMQLFYKNGGDESKRSDRIATRDIRDADGNVAIPMGTRMEVYESNKGGYVTREGYPIPAEGFEEYKERHSRESISQRQFQYLRDQDRYGTVRNKDKKGNFLPPGSKGATRKSQTNFRGLTTAFLADQINTHGERGA